MVYFQCETCIATLKKKQVETHYLTQCKNAHEFRCLTCQKIFDRDTIKGHTSCITEEEKYVKGDNMIKQSSLRSQKCEVVKCDPTKLKWSGFKKTSKKILKSYENYKTSIDNLVENLTKIFAKSQKVDVENCDKKMMKKLLFDKVEENKRFVIDLGKNTIRYKP